MNKTCPVRIVDLNEVFERHVGTFCFHIELIGDNEQNSNFSDEKPEKRKFIKFFPERAEIIFVAKHPACMNLRGYVNALGRKQRCKLKILIVKENGFLTEL